MTLQITVYSKSACPQCESAKMLLKSRNLPFEEIKIDDEAERLAFYAKCGPSVRQMPQIFINDQRVGGLAGLQAALMRPLPVQHRCAAWALPALVPLLWGATSPG
jgi:glutaredoxin 3